LGVLLEYRDQVLISVDTYRSEIAEKVLDLGVHIINDISGGEMDELMLNVVYRHQCIYVCMHMQGSPNSMQVNPTYGDVLMEILQYFAKKIFTLRQHGIEQVLIDPGFGFGKSLSHNYTLLDKLNTFAILEKPVLVGMSRKSMFYKVLETSAETSLSATLGGQMVALMHGASVLRVHDVAEASQIVKVFNYMTNNRKI
jgi:dihydropteroate synthase